MKEGRALESALKAAQWIVYGLAIVIWIGSAAFALWRNQQLVTLKPVRAEGIEAAAKSYMKSSSAQDASRCNVETKSRMYSATAKVRYQFLRRLIPLPRRIQQQLPGSGPAS